jgi:tRNA-modifying protein YgfZ
MQGWLCLPARGVLALSGVDRVAFLDRLVSNSVSSTNVTYTLLLSPQGKYLHDFFIVPQGDTLLLDCAYERRADLMARLLKYKLRSAIETADVSENYKVYAGSNLAQGFADPRHPEMGQRLLVQADKQLTFEGTEIPYSKYEEARIQCLLPDSLLDCEFERSFPLECNFDFAQAISFKKGCYIGQELTARMHYRDLLKRRLVRLDVIGPALPVGAEVKTIEGQTVGAVSSVQGQQALARLPFEQRGQPLTCNGQTLTLTWPPEMS